MLSDYVNVPALFTLFSNFFINVFFAASFIGFCSRKNTQSSRAAPEDASRPEGGNEECFTPPHISQLPSRSVLRHKQMCLIHDQCSEESDGWDTTVKSPIDVTFDSTQQNTASASFLERCTCFANQKRVRFQCPSTLSSKTITFSFH